MKAIVRTKAGKAFSTMRVMEINPPITQKGELKIKMISSRINPVDMDLMKGFPTLKYKNPQIGGIDGAGIVIEASSEVSNFNIGDKVLFYRLFSDIGTWAEEITIPAIHCAKIPNPINVIEAGACALPLLTAYESILSLQPKPFEKILIHGAAGSVGFQALQIAKKIGLFVIGTANANDKPILEKAGINQLIDYHAHDFLHILKAKEIDYVLDTLGDETLKKSITLQPKKIISLKFVDTDQMYKAGVHLPRMMKWIMKRIMHKFEKLAQQHHVILMGQVTGANGKMLHDAIVFVSQNFISKPFQTKTLSDIQNNGMTKDDVGKVIVF